MKFTNDVRMKLIAYYAMEINWNYYKGQLVWETAELIYMLATQSEGILQANKNKFQERIDILELDNENEN